MTDHPFPFVSEVDDPKDLLTLRRIARAELSGDPQWARLIDHARVCTISPWCRNYTQVYDEVRSDIS